MKVKRYMRCKKCGGSSFEFRWEYEEDKEMELYLCHSGMGFQLTDSIIKCSKCGEESDYEAEDFIETVKLEETKQ